MVKYKSADMYVGRSNYTTQCKLMHCVAWSRTALTKESLVGFLEQLLPESSMGLGGEAS